MYSKEKNREYYLQHQEACKARRRAYYKEHRDEIARKDKEKRLNRTPEERQRSDRYHRAYYLANREKLRTPEGRAANNARTRKWYKANLEAARAKGRKYTNLYREKNKEKVVASTERCRLERGARNKAFIEAYKLEHPCVRCGETDPVVLDFHHRKAGTKEFRIAAVIWSHKIAAIEAEIAKCDVLCANCHRREHYR